MNAAFQSYKTYTAAVDRVWSGAPRRRIEEAALYLTHVDGAHSLRAVSMASGKPLSTVHRAVRRIEALRDDPLIDTALESITPDSSDVQRRSRSVAQADPLLMFEDVKQCLGRLLAEGAFLLVARGAARAGCFTPENDFKRPALIVDVARASEMLARGWLTLLSRTELSAKYVVHRQAIAKLQAKGRLPTRGPDLSRAQQAVPALTRLARRTGRDGIPGLTPAGLAAARRLRDDHAATLLPISGTEGEGSQTGQTDERQAARQRLSRALDALGPGLSEPAFAVCCLDETLARVERRMGWAPRSARVVIGIALTRLAEHYGIEAKSA